MACMKSLKTDGTGLIGSVRWPCTMCVGTISYHARRKPGRRLVICPSLRRRAQEPASGIRRDGGLVHIQAKNGTQIGYIDRNIDALGSVDRGEQCGYPRLGAGRFRGGHSKLVDIVAACPVVTRTNGWLLPQNNVEMRRMDANNRPTPTAALPPRGLARAWSSHAATPLSAHRRYVRYTSNAPDHSAELGPLHN